MANTQQIRDGLLVLRCQQGDGAAFADLVQRWQERLWRHAYRLTANQDAAADIVQDSWMAVVKGIGRLQDADAFPAWMFRIVTNKSRDWVRKQQRRRWLHDLLRSRTATLPPAFPREDVRTDSLQAALAQLSLKQRALITLYYQEGFTTQEVADILGIPRGTVKSRLHHARDKIRRHMEEIHHA